MKTLIIIDAQIDFMPGGALPVPEGDRIVSVINSIQKDLDLVIATQDWHPANHISFASQHEGKSPFDIISLNNRPQTLWPDHCVQNSKGAGFHPGLNTEKWEAIFRKGTDKTIDSYSGFYDNGHLKSTGLTGYLREKGATDLYFCGLAEDICVYYSIKDALQEGFTCHLLDKASKPLDPEHFKKQVQELSGLGVEILWD